MEAMLLIFGIFFAYVLYSWVTSNTPEKKQVIPHNNPQSNKITTIDFSQNYHCWPGIGDYDFQVVGESNYQNSIKHIANNHGYDPESFLSRTGMQLKAFLIPENDNPYDNKAIRVDIDDQTVGYLAKEDARSFRRRLASKKLAGQITTCSAIITGGHSVNGKIMSYGCNLDIKPFD